MDSILFQKNMCVCVCIHTYVYTYTYHPKIPLCHFRHAPYWVPDTHITVPAGSAWGTSQTGSLPLRLGGGTSWYLKGCKEHPGGTKRRLWFRKQGLIFWGKDISARNLKMAMWGGRRGLGWGWLAMEVEGEGAVQKAGAAEAEKRPPAERRLGWVEEFLERSELRGVGAGRVGAEEELEPGARQLKIVNRNLIGGCLNPLLRLGGGGWRWGRGGKSVTGGGGQCGKAFKNEQ